MDILRIDDDFDPRGATALVVALDGWTDAGSGASTAAATLGDTAPSTTVGRARPDELFDFRDRRPVVSIDRGVFGAVTWPELTLQRIDPLDGTPFLLLAGAEPDFGWQALGAELVELARAVGLRDYVGMGSVPGPVPHTRPVRVTTTSNDEDLLERFGRAHEQMVVPASAQVTIEVGLGEMGLRTLGLWARVPHYVAGEYPAAASMLLQRLGEHLSFSAVRDELDEEAADHRERLDAAARDSEDVTAHIAALEAAYDADVADDAGLQGPLPTGDEIAHELEQFLRGRDG